MRRLLPVILLGATVLLAACGGYDDSASDDTTDAPVTDDSTGAAAGDDASPCDQMAVLIEPSEVAEAMGAELQPAGAIDGNGFCLVQLDVGVVGVGVETADTEQDAQEAYEEGLHTVTAAIDTPPEELSGVGDAAFYVTSPADQVFARAGSDMIVVGDTGSLELSPDEIRDGLTAVATTMADNAG